MSNYFMARIELHGSVSGDYTTLHDNLKQVGFNQEFTEKDVKYKLPTGTYFHLGSTKTIDTVKAQAETAAAATGFPPDALHKDTPGTSSIEVVQFTSHRHAGLQKVASPKTK